VVKVIKVSIKKEFNTNFKDGKAIRITAIKALSNLPGEYTSGYPHCFRSGNALIINKDRYNKIVLKQGELYDPDTVQSAIKLVNICGDRLRKINKRVKSNWETSKPRAIKI